MNCKRLNIIILLVICFLFNLTLVFAGGEERLGKRGRDEEKKAHEAKTKKARDLLSDLKSQIPEDRVECWGRTKFDEKGIKEAINRTSEQIKRQKREILGFKEVHDGFILEDLIRYENVEIDESKEICKGGKSLEKGDAHFFHYQGERGNQEDQHIAKVIEFTNNNEGIKANITAILDGHGGKLAAMIASEELPDILVGFLNYFQDRPLEVAIFNALKLSFVKMHLIVLKQTMGGRTSGTTVNLALSIPVSGDAPHQVTYVANLGDSRAILVRNNNEVVQVSRDDMLTEEDGREMRKLKKRGLLSNGQYFNGRIYTDKYGKRTSLNMLHALGDNRLPVEPRPQISKVKLFQGDKLLHICDGVYATSIPIHKMRNELLQTSSRAIGGWVTKSRSEGDDVSVKNIVTNAVRLGSGDNISALIYSPQIDQ